MFTVSRTTILPKLAIVLFSSVLVLAGGYIVRRTQVTAKASDTDVAVPKRSKVNISRTGKTFIKVSDAISLGSDNQPEQASERSLTLAAADFDEDGINDLATGAISAEGGIIRLQRGNAKAIYPDKNSSAIELPFFSATKNYASEITPDFMLTGDFDADGHADLLVAARNNSVLSFFSGDGKGNFAEPQIVFLAGNVTAVADGEINQADGLRDFAVGINAPEGAKVLLFSSAHGAWASQPQEIALQHSVTALNFGLLTNDSFSDLAIAAGSEFVLLQGRNRQAIPLRKNLPFAVQAMTVGNFSSHAQSQIGLLTSAGAVYLLQDTQLATISRRSGISSRANWQPELFYAPNSPASESLGSLATQLLRTRISNSAFDDLLVLRSGASPIQILSQQQAVESNQLTFSTTNEVLAALPLRLNASALQGVVFIRKNDTAPAFVAPEAAQTFTVNSVLDLPDDKLGDGVCAATPVTGGLPVCTLRAAIQEANANAGPDLVLFNISSGVQTINLTSALPPITDTISIDAVTQGTASPDQVIVLASFSTNFGCNPVLDIASGSSRVRGLRIIGFPCSTGIRLRNSGNNFVENNRINSNGNYGVVIDNSPNNTIGGSTTAGNTINENSPGEILIINIGARLNLVRGNSLQYTRINIGARTSRDEVLIVAASNNSIGGLGTISGNVISSTEGNGIRITSTLFANGALLTAPAEGNGIQGNTIVNASPPTNPSTVGVVLNFASNTLVGTPLIGVAALGAENTISGWNIGVEVDSQSNSTGIQNSILHNSIKNNTSLGIDLYPLGVTANDTGDVDIGANNLQNFPVITSAASTPTGALINGTLNSTPNTQFTIDLFSNAACDSSGYGEGEQFLGSVSTTTNANGDGSFTYTVSTGTPLPLGRSITATATDPNGNTSEFSACTAVREVTDLAVTQTVSPTPALSANLVTYTITVTNNGPSISSFPVVTIRPPTQLTNVTCTAPTGWSCNADGAFFASTTNFAPGSVTFTIQGTVLCLLQDSTLAATVTISAGQATDPAPANNTSTLNTPVRGGTAVGTVTYAAGATSLSLGPVIAGAVTTIPSGTFTLQNTGCLPMVLSTASFVRSGTTANIAFLDDSRLYVLRVINPDNSETTINPVNNPVSNAPRLYNINRTLQPGERVSYRVQFNPPLPLFAGKIGRTNDGISASQVLPDAVNSQLVFNFVAGSPFVGTAAVAESVGDAGTTAANIIGRVSPAVQIIPREGFTLPTALAEAQTEAAALVILDRIRDEFRVGISLYDANRNITKIAYQFFDTYGQVASAIIEVPVTDTIASSGLLIGQPFSMVQAFTGASKRPDVTSVRVTVTDGDGTVVSSSSNATATLSGLTQSIREPLRINPGDTIQFQAVELVPLNARRTAATSNRVDTNRVIKIQ